MMRPPIPGPTIRAMLKSDEFSAMAFGRSSRPTISTTNACRVGMSSELVRPSNAARTSTCQICTWPLATSAQSRTACSIANDCVNKSTLRLGRRSARTPPKRDRSITGKNCSAPTTPSNHALWVNSRTSHACPIDCIQVPINEISWPNQKRRKLRWRRAKKVRSRPFTCCFS